MSPYLRTVFQQHHGHEVDTQGDAFFVVFARATDVVVAAVDAQRALINQSWPEGVVVRVRMGLHTGEPPPLPLLFPRLKGLARAELGDVATSLSPALGQHGGPDISTWLSCKNTEGAPGR